MIKRLVNKLDPSELLSEYTYNALIYLCDSGKEFANCLYNIQEHNFRKEAIASQIHNMFKQVHLENQIHDSEFVAFKINGELLPSIKFKLIEDPIHDWFLIGAEDQIILLANNPLYETGQN